MEKFKAVVFTRDELESHDMSKLKVLSSIWAYQNSDLTVGNKTYDF